MVSQQGLPSQPETAPDVAPGPSPPCPCTGWERIVATTLLATGPVLFWGIVLSDIVYIAATVYDGVNANGRPVCSAQTAAGFAHTVPIILKKPILLQNGLFVNLSAVPDDCLVLFDPLPSG